MSTSFVAAAGQRWTGIGGITLEVGSEIIGGGWLCVTTSLKAV